MFVVVVIVVVVVGVAEEDAGEVDVGLIVLFRRRRVMEKLLVSSCEQENKLPVTFDISLFLLSINIEF